MSIPNCATLAQLDQMPIGEIARLPVEQLAMLLEDLAEERNRLKKLDDWLNGALTLRYGDRAQALRIARGQSTGRVNVEEENGFTVSCDLPKKVEWNQGKLADAIATIRSWDENPDEYVQIEIKVAETKYAAWPSAIKKLFEPARTLKAGRPSYTIKEAKP